MAQVREVKLLDDKIKHETGEDVIADVTVEFGLGGRHYEIDLTKEHSDELHNALAPFVSAARRAGSTKAVSTRSADRLNREESQKIRDWARSRGMEVSDRGRIPAEIRQAYARATAGSAQA